MKGMFGLTTPQDLLAKLRHDHARLQQDSNNAYVAFDFFVTAEHLLDWLYPGSTNRATREQLRSQEVLLGLVSHIANGAKHFDNLSKHHQSVTHASQRGGFFGARYFGARFFGSSYWGGRRLGLTLTGPAAVAFGQMTTALDLATQVLRYWEAQPALVT